MSAAEVVRSACAAAVLEHSTACWYVKTNHNDLLLSNLDQTKLISISCNMSKELIVPVIERLTDYAQCKSRDTERIHAWSGRAISLFKSVSFFFRQILEKFSAETIQRPISSDWPKSTDPNTGIRIATTPKSMPTVTSSIALISWKPLKP